MSLKSLMTRSRQIKLNMIKIEKQIKFLYYDLKNWVHKNI